MARSELAVAALGFVLVGGLFACAANAIFSRGAEVISEPYKISYEECVETVDIPTINFEGEPDTMEVCNKYQTVYEVVQEVRVSGLWWDYDSRVSRGRVDKDYVVSFNYSTEK